MLNGWKTLIFALLVAALGVAQSADWINLLGSELGGYVLTAIGVGYAVLRVFTTVPVFTPGAKVQTWHALVLSGGVTLVGALQSQDWVSLLGSSNGGYVLMAIGVVGAALRFLTNSPVAAPAAKTVVGIAFAPVAAIALAAVLGLSGCASTASIVSKVVVAATSKTATQAKSVGEATQIAKVLEEGLDLYVTNGNPSQSVLAQLRTGITAVHTALKKAQAADKAGNSALAAGALEGFNQALAAYRTYAVNQGVSV